MAAKFRRVNTPVSIEVLSTRLTVNVKWDWSCVTGHQHTCVGVVDPGIDDWYKEHCV